MEIGLNVDEDRCWLRNRVDRVALMANSKSGWCHTMANVICLVDANAGVPTQEICFRFGDAVHDREELHLLYV